MEGFGFLNPFVQHGGDGQYGEDYGGNLLIDSKGEVLNEHHSAALNYPY